MREHRNRLKLAEKYGFSLNTFPQEEFNLVFISNPNNPTGNLLLKNHNINNFSSKLIVVDEAFMDFLPEERKNTLIWKATEDKGIVILRSFTKFFALPGLRLGYLVAHQQNIQRLSAHHAPWSVNSLAQIAGELVLKDRNYFNSTRVLIEKERNFLSAQLGKICGIKVYPSVTNFLLLKIEKNGVNADDLAKRLLERGILIRNCGDFHNLDDKFIRVAVRKRNENKKLITAIKEILG
jgi:threonine-phosphate decarboxylase